MAKQSFVDRLRQRWLSLAAAALMVAGLGAVAAQQLNADDRAPVSPADAAAALYPPVAQATGDLSAGLRRATAEKKRVLVAFGANWCPDCRVLGRNLRRPENLALIEQHFVVVKINVGDKGISDNLDVAQRMGVSLNKGVPAVAVLAADGSVVHAQKNGEFEPMRQLDPKTVTDYLNRWKG